MTGNNDESFGGIKIPGVFKIFGRIVLIILLYNIVMGNNSFMNFNRFIQRSSNEIPAQVNSQEQGIENQKIFNNVPKNVVHSLNVPDSVVFDLLVIFSEYSKLGDLKYDKLDPSYEWHEKGFLFGNWDQSQFRKSHLTLKTPKYLLENGTMYSHIFFYPTGTPKHILLKEAMMNTVPYYHNVYPVTKYYSSYEKKDLKRNLIKGNDEEYERIMKESKLILPHWPGNMTIVLVNEKGDFPHNSIPPVASKMFKFDNNHNYNPLIWLNDFWLLRESYHPIKSSSASSDFLGDSNESDVNSEKASTKSIEKKKSKTTTTSDPMNLSEKLELDIYFEPVSILRYFFFIQLSQSSKEQEVITGMNSEAQLEIIKKMFIDNPPWLLVLTMVISIIHSVLDLLAFKNEIYFWSSRKTMQGLSLKSLYIEMISQVIIFLYLLDNDTSWMILISSGASILIDLWKFKKAIKIEFIYKDSIKIQQENSLSQTKDESVKFSTEIDAKSKTGPALMNNLSNLKFPFIKFSENSSYVSKTKKFDEEAIRYLMYILYPLIFCYFIYSLLYKEHKSWYSFIIGSFAGCIYTFGFIMMTPQLFINYRLKSVAHLPWRTFVYKSINTFIDDLFSFIIRMPTMHRLRCFRDDIIFFIYLYQRWLYPVDKNRLEVLDGDLGASVCTTDIENERQEYERKNNKEYDFENKEDIPSDAENENFDKKDDKNLNYEVEDNDQGDSQNDNLPLGKSALEKKND